MNQDLLPSLNKSIKQLRTQITQYEISSVEISSLKSDILTTRKQLGSSISNKSFALKLGSMAILFGLSLSTYSQSFKAPIELYKSDKLFGPSLASDIDGDGTLDLIGLDLFSNDFIGYLKNNSTNNIPSVNEDSIIEVNLNDPDIFGNISYVDFDNDGDLDAFYKVLSDGEYYSNTANISYQENFSGNNQFDFSGSPKKNPFELERNFQASEIHSLDLDGDGDFDILSADYNGTIYLSENIGSVNEGKFAPLQSFLETVGGVSMFISSADFDNDGDQDILVGNYAYNNETNTIEYYNVYFKNENNEFVKTDLPHEIFEALQFGFVTSGDFDDDGDMDILYSNFDYEGNNVSVHFLENVLINSVNEIETEITLYPNPASQQLQWNTTEQISSVKVLSISGAEVLNEQVNGNSVQIDHLKSGNYIIELTNFNGEKKSLSFQKI